MEITASNSEYPETPKNPFIKEYGINYSRIPNMILEVLSRGGGHVQQLMVIPAHDL